MLKCKRNRATAILDHLNSIDPDDIRFTKEEEKDNQLAVLDLELNVNRKKKKIEFNVHYKATNTNITIKKHSNHREAIKRRVIKGYGDRARALCDPEYLQGELDNIEAVFMENGYSRQEIQEAMKERPKKTTEEEEQPTRGIVLMPNIPHFTEKFNKIARRHRFKTANKTDNKVRDLTSKAKTPLGKKNNKIVYRIPCKCEKNSYNGETDRKWESREKEHKDKVRLTQRDIAAGDMDGANKRMNDNDGGLAKHSTTCNAGIDWENAKIIGKERRWSQRKYLEGVESIKERSRGITPLNSYNKMEHWQETIYSFLE